MGKRVICFRLSTIQPRLLPIYDVAKFGTTLVSPSHHRHIPILSEMKMRKGVGKVPYPTRNRTYKSY
jgi:hypothetical protein